MKTEDTGLQALSQKLYECDSEIRDLEETIKGNPAYGLATLVTRKGEYKGEIKYVTTKQYRKFIGVEPPPSVFDKQGKIPWENVLDQLATSEYGRTSNGERLKNRVEKLVKDMERLRALKVEKSNIKSEFKAAKKSPPKKETIVTVDSPPVFDKGELSKAIVTEVNGYEMRARRNPSFYQIEDNKPETPHFRVRYAADARKLMNEVARERKKDIITSRRLQPKRRVTNPHKRTIAPAASIVIVENPTKPKFVRFTKVPGVIRGKVGRVKRSSRRRRRVIY